jgi:hypothetical protein
MVDGAAAVLLLMLVGVGSVVGVVLLGLLMLL